MTLWTPKLNSGPEPIYRRIADAIERDVRSGLLVDGSQLPTHRELARLLDITAVTVTRAYAEAQRRGLVSSATGRGTFVRVSRESAAPATEIDLATNLINVPMAVPTAAMLQRAATMLNTSYGATAGSDRHRTAGAVWIGRNTDPSRILVTAGTQHALFIAMLATARADETVMCESVTYHNLKAVAHLLRVRLEPLAMDRYGILPDAFERAARARNAKTLVTIPNLQNPTGVVMPEKRRRDLSVIAETHGITIIEDDVCGFLLDDPPLPLASFAPQRTIFLTGLGKALAPAMRIGYIAAPDALFSRIQSVLNATALFASPILGELAATWIEDGTATRLALRKREEVALRTTIARRILGRRATGADPRSPHLWVELPRRWTADAFADEARRRNVRVASGSLFAVGDETPRNIRISIAAPSTPAELESALHVIAGIDEERMEPVV
jgi:DNA-binding transcriptional MocR family regulator